MSPVTRPPPVFRPQRDGDRPISAPTPSCPRRFVRRVTGWPLQRRCGMERWMPSPLTTNRGMPTTSGSPSPRLRPGGAGLATLLGVTLAQVHGSGLALGGRDRPAHVTARHVAGQRRWPADQGQFGRSLPVQPGTGLACGGRIAARKGSQHHRSTAGPWKAGWWARGRRDGGCSVEPMPCLSSSASCSARSRSGC